MFSPEITHGRYRLPKALKNDKTRFRKESRFKHPRLRLQKKPPKVPGLPDLRSRNSLNNEENVHNFRTIDTTSRNYRYTPEAQFYDESEKYRKSGYFKNSMQMLRAIGNGQVNIGLSYDIRSLDKPDVREKNGHPIHQNIRLCNTPQRLTEMSYVQFFDDLVKENKKKGSSGFKRFKEQVPPRQVASVKKEKRKPGLMSGIISMIAKKSGKLNVSKKKMNKMELYNKCRLSKKSINKGIYEKVLLLSTKHKKPNKLPMTPEIADISARHDDSLNMSSAKPDIANQSMMPVKENLILSQKTPPPKISDPKLQQIKSNFRNSRQSTFGGKSIKMVQSIGKKSGLISEANISNQASKPIEKARKTLDPNVSINTHKENLVMPQRDAGSPMIKIERLKTKDKANIKGALLNNTLMGVKQEPMSRMKSSLPKRYKNNI
ncbi:unnamed protein product [Moneuplotes crassus]|uniref:Uncharacterized protein n=1 Tax=Euplotes crassus TaxID=5936 RepID=A0AAD1UM09_EUPCR|nr:unnamed protein product [Moneuplotes crassus]